ncbi:uncharacterized protein BDZ99DRAFT_475245 [Mytilinidion resinicola]|uniref:RING-type domain-containing protein n=1 Tax=Mytilinidion resinicola TaxID=574789 RepID=A0A6A6YUU5_9PEZI|nr:uncharacterized protein BDZ99DRAFT_475245 [Mytilinidion resinicola]KAF2811727.1 hypothetical protein BDZ99DRAFT_475245 [Mytilinidion resinicola]
MAVPIHQPALPSKTHFLAHMLQPSLLTDPFRGPNCPICHEEYTADIPNIAPDEPPEQAPRPRPHNAVRILPCNHIFGEPCLRRWLDSEARPNRCMFCRVELFEPEREVEEGLAVEPVGEAGERQARADPAVQLHELRRQMDILRDIGNAEQPVDREREARAPDGPPRPRGPPWTIRQLVDHLQGMRDLVDVDEDRRLVEQALERQREALGQPPLGFGEQLEQRGEIREILRERLGERREIGRVVPGLDREGGGLQVEQRQDRANEGLQGRIRGLLDQLMELREAMDGEEERLMIEHGLARLRGRQRQEVRDLRDAEANRQRLEQDLDRERQVLGQQQQQLDHANERLAELREIREIIQGLRRMQEGMVAPDSQGWDQTRLRMYETLFALWVAAMSLIVALGLENVVMWVDVALRDWGMWLIAVASALDLQISKLRSYSDHAKIRLEEVANSPRDKANLATTPERNLLSSPTISNQLISDTSSFT